MNMGPNSPLNVMQDGSMGMDVDRLLRVLRHNMLPIQSRGNSDAGAQCAQTPTFADHHHQGPPPAENNNDFDLFKPPCCASPLPTTNDGNPQQGGLLPLSSLLEPLPVQSTRGGGPSSGGDDSFNNGNGLGFGGCDLPSAAGLLDMLSKPAETSPPSQQQDCKDHQDDSDEQLFQALSANLTATQCGGGSGGSGGIEPLTVQQPGSDMTGATRSFGRGFDHSLDAAGATRSFGDCLNDALAFGGGMSVTTNGVFDDERNNEKSDAVGRVSGGWQAASNPLSAAAAPRAFGTLALRGIRDFSGSWLPVPSLSLSSSSNAAAAAAKTTTTTNNCDVAEATLPQQLRFKPFHEEKWSQRLDELRHFRKKHGHCLVPHTYPPNPQLARWVKRQRRQYKLLAEGKISTMTPERVEVLEDVGFVWDSHEASWREKIQELRRYRARHGNCLVPSGYKASPSLAVWVKCQRRQYKLYNEGKGSAMTDERIRELEAEGFCWEVRGPPPPTSSATQKTAAQQGSMVAGQDSCLAV